jgi:3-oxoacyl-[acyl-carrier protein] reductase
MTRYNRAKSLLIVGASRGIGAAVAQHLYTQGHTIYAVSRTPPQVGEWITADVSQSEGIEKIVNAVGNTPIDALLYLGGVWEHDAFTENFDFRQSSDSETRFVISVNLIGPIELTKRLAGNLASTENPRAIYIGALSGLDQRASPEVANTASKFGLRGAVQALRLAFKDEGIGFTVINPGNVATEEVERDISEGRFQPQVPIPLGDLISAIDWILGLSPATETGDINLMQR